MYQLCWCKCVDILLTGTVWFFSIFRTRFTWYMHLFLLTRRLFRTAIDPLSLLIAYTFKEGTSHSVSHCLQLQTGSNILFLDPAAQCTGWSLCLYNVHTHLARHPIFPWKEFLKLYTNAPVFYLYMANVLCVWRYAHSQFYAYTIEYTCADSHSHVYVNFFWILSILYV